MGQRVMRQVAREVGRRLRAEDWLLTSSCTTLSGAARRGRVFGAALAASFPAARAAGGGLALACRARRARRLSNMPLLRNSRELGPSRSSKSQAAIHSRPCLLACSGQREGGGPREHGSVPRMGGSLASLHAHSLLCSRPEGAAGAGKGTGRPSLKEAGSHFL